MRPQAQGSLAQDETLELAEGGFDQGLLLVLVQVCITHRRRGRGGAAGIAQALAVEHVVVDVVLDNTGMVNDAIRCLAYMSRIVILGFAARKGVMESVKMNKLLLKSATVVGYRFGESGRRKPDELARIWEG